MKLDQKNTLLVNKELMIQYMIWGLKKTAKLLVKKKGIHIKVSKKRAFLSLETFN